MLASSETPEREWRCGVPGTAVCAVEMCSPQPAVGHGRNGAARAGAGRLTKLWYGSNCNKICTSDNETPRPSGAPAVRVERSRLSAADRGLHVTRPTAAHARSTARPRAHSYGFISPIGFCGAAFSQGLRGGRLFACCTNSIPCASSVSITTLTLPTTGSLRPALWCVP